uniref:Enoyl-CoA hydratase 1 n=1 Tax=Accipiter nisus TaxID=211598 RepID=A0A8B9MET1_9AVES
MAAGLDSQSLPRDSQSLPSGSQCPGDRLGAAALRVPARLMLVEAAEQCLPSHSFETLWVMLEQDRVLHVELHHPEKRIAVNMAFWREMVEYFQDVGQDSSCHAIVISGAGKCFTAGIDLMGMGSEFMMVEGEDRARKAWNLCRNICEYQETFLCPKPVIAAVRGACVGAGVDLISEVDIRLVADVGTLQHLPKIRGRDPISPHKPPCSLINELAFTAHKMMAPEAQSSSLVSWVVADKEMLLHGALEVATAIAAQSPVAVQGTKVNLLCSWDHPVPKSLCYVNWNVQMMCSAIAHHPPLDAQLVPER